MVRRCALIKVCMFIYIYIHIHIHIYIYIAARITRHCAISLRTCSLDSFISECRKQAVCNGISRFGEVRIMIFGYFGGPLAATSDCRRPLWLIFRILRKRIQQVPSRTHPNGGSNQLFAVLCHWCFFSPGAIFRIFFVNWGVLRLSLASIFLCFFGSLGLWKDKRKCIK